MIGVRIERADLDGLRAPAVRLRVVLGGPDLVV